MTPEPDARSRRSAPVGSKRRVARCVTPAFRPVRAATTIHV